MIKMSVKGPILFIVKRAIALYLIVVLSVYITIVIANLGGYVDRITQAQILEDITFTIKRDPQYRGLPPEEVDRIIRDTYELELKKLGLDTPFIVRSFRYLVNGLTLDLGRALYLTSDTGSRQVKLIILERLPQTVMLFTTASVLNFFIHLFLGLYLSRHYGGKLDKLFIALSPTSIVPGWLYGLFLIMIFASILRVLPYGGYVDVPPPDDPVSYGLSVLKHMILPLSSWIISGFFMGVYGSRTFYLIFSTEDYVTVAKAKGLPPRIIERRYILRPALPPVITSFSLGLIGSWGGAIITETVFNWPGLGKVMRDAINSMDTPVIVGEVIIYAYLLAITVLLLDILYLFIDPRIRARFR